MRIIDIRCVNGPNFWSVRKCKLVVMKLDLEEFEERPTNRIEGFYERLKLVLPTLQTHFCSEGHPGGFFERVKDGTWMGHVIEHIALEMQTLADMDCGFGRTRGTGEYGVYHVVFEYKDKEAGVLAAESAVAMALALSSGQPFNLSNVIQQLRTTYYANKLGPSTGSIVSACDQMNIPHFRLNSDSHVQLGYGSKQRQIEATTTSNTSYLAVELAGDKFRSKQVLDMAGIPVPRGLTVTDEKGLLQATRELGFPLVIKPLDSNQGKGVTTAILNSEKAIEAFNLALLYSNQVIAEQYITGHDYRLLIIDNKFRAAAKRTPACVYGDGISSVGELINQVNQDPRRGEGHQNMLSKIVVDDALKSHLSMHGLTLDTVIPSDIQVMVANAANLSKGGTSEDVTDDIHPEIISMGERIARIIGLDICGIDMIANDITKPLKASGASVIEVNASPGFRMHLSPSVGKPRNVGQDVANMLFPNGSNGRIPIIAVTGTNGKTTTTRIAAHLMRQGGACVGYTTTDGIYIDGQMIEQGDCSGPESARTVLKDPTVDIAVLETARGGMLRSGLAFDQCDVGIVTNVASDHLGLNDICTLEQMTRVKAIVPKSVKPDGYAVLNAGNDESYYMKDDISCNIALFSITPDNERIQMHRKAGGLACVLNNGFITICNSNDEITVESAVNIPATFGGKCTFMIENILGAVLAAYTQGIDVEKIAAGLRSFQVTDESTPGRLNHFHFRQFEVIVDYAHNPHSMNALGQYLDTIECDNKLGIITGVGDRRDEDITEIGSVAAKVFDEIIIRLDNDLRGRKQHEMINLIKRGVKATNPFCRIKIIQDELQAINFAMRHYKPGQLIVLLTDKIWESISMVRGFKELEEEHDIKDRQLLQI